MKKLLNKKTGKVFDAIIREKVCDGIYSIIVCDIKEYSKPPLARCILGEYNSLAELNEEWEDYEPKEPLIKDERIRKAVRAWAEANDKRVFEVQVCYQSYGDGSWSLRDTTHEEDCGLAFIGEIPEGLNLGSRYTITELCGEEKE